MSVRKCPDGLSCRYECHFDSECRREQNGVIYDHKDYIVHGICSLCGERWPCKTAQIKTLSAELARLKGENDATQGD